MYFAFSLIKVKYTHRKIYYLNHYKWTVQWHEIHSYCCATITTMRLQNGGIWVEETFKRPSSKHGTWKHASPFLPPPGPHMTQKLTEPTWTVLTEPTRSKASGWWQENKGKGKGLCYGVKFSCNAGKASLGETSARPAFPRDAGNSCLWAQARRRTQPGPTPKVLHVKGQGAFSLGFSFPAAGNTFQARRTVKGKVSARAPGWGKACRARMSILKTAFTMGLFNPTANYYQAERIPKSKK